jgi:predicted dehydrogenase
MGVHIVQVGCGRWGANVLRDLKQVGATVTAVARSEASVARARERGADRIVERLEDAGPADGIVIVTPAPDHARAIRDAAALGVPIFCEKPLVTDPSVAGELLEATGDRLFVMHKWRWHPGVEALGELASSGRLGEITGVRTTRLGWGPFHFRVDSVDTLAPHDLSIAIAVLGELPPVLAARGTPYPGLERGWAEISAMLAGPSGPRVMLECSAVSAHRLRRVEVTGTLGSAALADSEAPFVEVLTHGGELEGEADREEIELEREWPLLRELRDFVAHCGGGPPPRATGAEGFTVCAAIEELRAVLDDTRQPAGAQV